MMRNVALGAVIGFGVAVLLLSICASPPAPPALPPAVDNRTAVLVPPADAGEPAPRLMPILDNTPMLAQPTRNGQMMRNLQINRPLMFRAPADAGP